MQLRITWYGHSCFLIAFEAQYENGAPLDEALSETRVSPGTSASNSTITRDSERRATVSVMIDPFIIENPILDNVDIQDVARNVDHIITSHGHTESIGDLVKMAKMSNALVTANQEVCAWAKAHGVTRLNPMNTGGTVDLGTFKVSLTPAQHSSSHVDASGVITYLGEANGVVIEISEEPTLYYAGDTAAFSDMALIDEIYKPKIGLFPISGTFTMGCRQAASVIKKYFHLSHVIPCHYPTYESIAQDADAFASELAGSTTELYAPKPGGTVEIK